MSPEQLPPIARTVLEQTISRALMSSGSALGEMTGRRIVASRPEVDYSSPGEIVDGCGGAETVVLGVYVGFSGSIEGHIIVILQPDDAHRLARLMLSDLVRDVRGQGVDLDPLDFDDLELSCLSEVGNVAAARFLNEVGMHFHEPARPSVPQTVLDMAGATLDGLLGTVLGADEQVFVGRTTFSEGDEKVRLIMLVLPRSGSLVALADALGARIR